MVTNDRGNFRIAVMDLDRESLLAGRDPQLEAALEWIAAESRLPSSP